MESIVEPDAAAQSMSNKNCTARVMAINCDRGELGLGLSSKIAKPNTSGTKSAIDKRCATLSLIILSL